MRRSKPKPKAGLADLKALRKQAQAAAEEPPPPPAATRRIARKRSPFLPPSDARGSTGAAAARPAHDAAKPAPASRASTATSAADPAARLSDADRRLFMQAVRYVDRIKDPGRVLLPPVADAPASILRERRLRAAGEESTAKRPRPQQRPDPAREVTTNDTPAPRRSGQGPRAALSDTYAPAASETDDRQYLKTGHGPDVLRDLKRGKWMIGANLDLHGSTVDDARERFERFVASCLAHDVKCVRIVHGKGLGSPNGDAVLKTTVRRWLTQLPEVIAYAECAVPDGGSGAVQVLLQHP